MKINVYSIIRCHWRTLSRADTGKISASDIFLFYVLPAAAGLIAYIFCFTVKTDVYNVSITFFGIFIALLLNIQVAMFAIFQRKWDDPEDERLAKLQRARLAVRRKLLEELNANISYLMVVSSVSLIVFLGFFVADSGSGINPAIGVILYSHFILTFLMVVKRAHALFQKEYSDNLT